MFHKEYYLNIIEIYPPHFFKQFWILLLCFKVINVESVVGDIDENSADAVLENVPVGVDLRVVGGDDEVLAEVAVVEHDQEEGEHAPEARHHAAYDWKVAPIENFDKGLLEK